MCILNCSGAFNRVFYLFKNACLLKSHLIKFSLKKETGMT